MEAQSKSIAEYKKKYPAAFELTYPRVPAKFLPANESKLRLLNQYDTVFLVDDSTSMTKRDGDREKSRWTTAGVWLGVLAEIAAAFDRDGIDIYFFNNRDVGGKHLKSRSDVEKVFNRVQYLKAGTPTRSSIYRVLYEYFRQFEQNPRQLVKPLNLVVITDGAPNPQTEDPRDAIEFCISKLDQLRVPHNFRQVGIMFAQVGRDEGATQLLHALDNLYTNTGRRDIVDTFKGNLSNIVHLSQDDWSFSVVKLLVGAIDKNMDNTDHKPIATPNYPQQQPLSYPSGWAPNHNQQVPGWSGGYSQQSGFPNQQQQPYPGPPTYSQSAPPNQGGYNPNYYPTLGSQHNYGRQY